jgi:transcriptional regulator of arginine metabolism
MLPKPSRQRTILDLVQQRPVTSQEDLKHALSRVGVKVGQATLSRDLRELGLVKTVHGYSVSAAVPPAEPALPPMSRLAREFVLDVRPAQNLLVIKTTVGSAQPVAASLDGEEWSEIVGSVAGDDTILIVCADKKTASKLAARIRGMLA